MSRWYRAYEGTVTDAKLGEVALVAGCSRSVAIAAWHCILESCAACNDAGRFDATARRVAVILQEPVAAIEKVFSELESLGMIAQGAVAAWSKRQYESDNSTERSRKHRETKRNADATLQQRSATPPETDTDTDTEAEREDARAQGHQEIAVQIIKATDFPLSSWEDGFLSNIAALPKLTAEQQTTFDAISKRWAGRQPNAPPPPPQFAVIEGSEAWAAWQRVRKKRLPVTDLQDPAGHPIGKRGWYFPTEFPEQKGATA